MIVIGGNGGGPSEGGGVVEGMVMVGTVVGGTVVEVVGGTAVVVVPTEGAEVVAGAVAVRGDVEAVAVVVSRADGVERLEGSYVDPAT